MLLLALAPLSIESDGLDLNQPGITAEEARDWVGDLAERLPSRISVHTIGYSQERRPLWFAVLHGRGHPRELGRPAVFVNSLHHGDEWATLNASLAWIHSYLKDPRPDARVDATAFDFVVMPVVNPDGYARRRRGDRRGRDINRDYWTPGRKEQQSFRTPEAAAVKRVVDRYRPVAAVALHTGDLAVFWPWCHSNLPHSASSVFQRLAASTATALGTTKARSSFFDYPTLGEFIDFAFARHGTLALTLEVGEDEANVEGSSRRHARSVSRRTVAALRAYVKELSRLAESGAVDLGAGRTGEGIAPSIRSSSMPIAKARSMSSGAVGR